MNWILVNERSNRETKHAQARLGVESPFQLAVFRGLQVQRLHWTLIADHFENSITIAQKGPIRELTFMPNSKLRQRIQFVEPFASSKLNTNGRLILLNSCCSLQSWETNPTRLCVNWCHQQIALCCLKFFKRKNYAHEYFHSDNQLYLLCVR